MNKKIIAIANNKILMLRIDAILAEKGFKAAEVLSTTTINGKHLDLSLRDASLLLIDLENKDVEGIEVIHKIRTFKNKAELPILVFSSNNDVAKLSQAIHAGSNDVILKPFVDETLTSKLLKHMYTEEKTPTEPIVERHEESIESYHVALDKIPHDTKLKWSDDFKIGHEQIDQEHQLIVEKYAMLYDLMKEGKGHEYYRQLILFLIDYVDFHFDNEEKIQAENGYLGQLRHKKLHEAFKIEVKKMIERQEASEITNAELVRFNLFLKNWLIYHILIEDRSMIEHLKD